VGRAIFVSGGVAVLAALVLLYQSVQTLPPSRKNFVEHWSERIVRLSIIPLVLLAIYPFVKEPGSELPLLSFGWWFVVWFLTLLANLCIWRKWYIVAAVKAGY
jgi:hypothetical protein